MIKDILIATILPNGTHTDGYRFSLCVDFNRNIDPATCTPAGLSDVLASMPALLNQLHTGFLLDVEGTEVQVGTIELTGTPAQATAIREAAWAALFGGNVSDATFKSNRNLQAAEAMGNINNISQELKALQTGLTNNVPADIAAVATRMAATLGAPVRNLRKNLRDIHTYSVIEGQRAKERYYQSVQARGGAIPALEQERTTVTMEQLLDIAGLITENNMLQRLTGFTIDFRVPFTAVNVAAPKIRLKLPATHAWSNSIVTLTSQMQLFSRQAGGITRRAMLLKGLQTGYSGIYSSTDLKLYNHDRLTKTDALDQVMQTVQAATVSTDAGREELVRKLRKIDTNTATIGLALYHDNWNEHLNSSGKDLNGNEVLSMTPTVMAGDKLVKEAFYTIDPGSVMQEINLIKGHRFGLQTGSATFVSLGTRRCNPVIQLPGSTAASLPEVRQEFCVNTDSGMETFNEDTGEVRPIVDETLFNWAGENLGLPSAFASLEKEDELPPSNDEGGMDVSTQAAMEKLAGFVQEEFFPFNIKITRPGAPSAPVVRLRYEPVRKSNPKLVFGKNYRVLMVNEYKNGWGLSFSNDPGSPELSAADMFAIATGNGGFILPQIDFKRNEPVKPIAVFPHKRLLNAAQTAAAPDMEGESLNHLVIRSTGVHNVNLISTRLLLPPQISFQHAFWHHKIFEMDPAESFAWYKRYHDPANKALAMPLENLVPVPRPSYLWDPLVKGFSLEFYFDKEYTHKASAYYKPDGTPYGYNFTTGSAYPLVTAARLQIVDDMDDNTPKVEMLPANAGIRVRLPQGEELFCLLRTRLHDAALQQLETYGYADSGTLNGSNDWLTPPQKFRLTHACKKPLVTPRFISMEKAVQRPAKTSMADFTIRLHMEHLNLVQEGGVHKYIEDTLPTGEMELYATWDEYLDDPRQFVADNPDWTPELPFRSRNGQSPSFECKIDIGAQCKEMSDAVAPVQALPNSIKNYGTEMRINYDVKDMRHIVKYYVLKNKSSFTGFYKAENTDANFSLQSPVFAVPVHILNNRKPVAPVVHHVMPLLVTDEQVSGNTVTKTTAGSRFRIFFERGRLTSGEGERIAFLVQQLQSTYNAQFEQKDLLSITGRDITTDNEKPTVGNVITNPNVYLQSGNFTMTDPSGTRPADIALFKPEYVSDLGMVTYAPKFDVAQNLWYVDVDLKINSNGKWLHSPFVLLAAAHYQQYSSNHNETGEADMTKDCRFSDIIKIPPVYILPQRKVAVTRVSGSRATVKLTADDTSLIAQQAKKKTVFLAIVQESEDNLVWETARLNNKGGGTDAYKEISPLFSETVQLDYTPTRKNQRLLVLEIEAFDKNFILPQNYTDVQEDKQNRIVFIQTFNI